MGYFEMKRSEKKNRLRQFRKDEQALLDILNEWEPIGFRTPPDEYDCLAHHVLSLLHSGCSLEKLVDKIRTEIYTHFCLTDIPASEIKETAQKIWAWWKSRAQ